ncbi:nitroreductase family protein [Lacticaseibacillus camelliae]|uniref:nitroreductase family protein n=1 Tax=Lacticaseibacillus camelliae TaxID=381742 RepID=UPI000AE8DC2E
MSEPLNDMINRQLHHRTIRYFTDEPLPQETLTQLVAVAQHTATSHYLQSFSVLSITDRHLRGQIAAIAKQPYINQNGHLFVFVADQHCAAVIAQQAGVSQTHLGSTDKFIQAVSDAVLAAQNVVNAAESLGWGPCCSAVF